ncbi:MAG: hypothetical protein AAF363_21920 [Bacteroidota bacterium]
MNSIDHIFRDKLESHEVKASESAWAKLDSSLESKKNPIRFWFLGIAASLLLLMICSPFFKSSTHVDSRAIANISPVEIPNKSQFSTPETIVSEPSVTIAKVKKEEGPLDQIFTETESEKTTIAKQQIVNIEPKTYSFNIASNSPFANSKTDALSNKNHSMQITYVASTVEKKDEKSTLGKLWARAVDLKNGEGDINFRGFKDKFLSTSKTNSSNGGR